MPRIAAWLAACGSNSTCADAFPVFSTSMSPRAARAAPSRAGADRHAALSATRRAASSSSTPPNPLEDLRDQLLAPSILRGGSESEVVQNLSFKIYQPRIERVPSATRTDCCVRMQLSTRILACDPRCKADSRLIRSQRHTVAPFADACALVLRFQRSAAVEVDVVHLSGP